MSGKGMSGWLAPSGAFYPCDWQNHHELAFKILDADVNLMRERVRLGYEAGTVISYDDALKNMDWIVMGTSPYNPDDDYIFFPIHDLYWQRTQQQIDWFESNFEKLSPMQLQMLDDYIDSIL